jgi:hypothetical protein
VQIGVREAVQIQIDAGVSAAIRKWGTCQTVSSEKSSGRQYNNSVALELERPTQSISSLCPLEKLLEVRFHEFHQLQRAYKDSSAVLIVTPIYIAYFDWYSTFWGIRSRLAETVEQ